MRRIVEKIGILLKVAMRDLRGQPAHFRIFMASLFVSALSLAAVESLNQSFSQSLSSQGRTILGGDILASLQNRAATEAERETLASKGQISTSANFRAMIRASNGKEILAEVKAVDNFYPLYGELETKPRQKLLQETPHIAFAEPALLTRLELKENDIISLGETQLTIKATLVNEPDRLAGGLEFGPRLLVPLSVLPETKLLQPGSLVRWSYAIKQEQATGEEDIKDLISSIRLKHQEAGFSFRSRLSAAPQLQRQVERFSQFLNLTGLTALLIGGVGITTTMRRYLALKQTTIAILKSIGASGSRITTIYIFQIMIFATISAALGAMCGTLTPYLVNTFLANVLPIKLIPHFHPEAMLIATSFALITSLTASLWPLGEAKRTSPTILFRAKTAALHTSPPISFMVAGLLGIGILAVMVLVTATDSRIAKLFLVSASVTYVILRLLAILLIKTVERAPRPSFAPLRMALASLSRAPEQTITIIIAMGLSLSLMISLTLIDLNIRSTLQQGMPARAPSFYMMDMPMSGKDTLKSITDEQAPAATLEWVPMLRGRIVKIKDVLSEDIKAPDTSRWVLNSDRGITYSASPPPGSHIVEGQWWPENYTGKPLMSFDIKLAEGLGLKVGDNIEINVLGRNITAQIANLRAIRWEGLGINFAMVFSPNTFVGAPHTALATLTYPTPPTEDEEARLIKKLGESLPTITYVRVREVLEAVTNVMKNLGMAIRISSIVGLMAGGLVLAAALSAGQQYREYEAVMMKVLGASRQQIITAMLLEYLLLGGLTASIAMFAGGLTAYTILTEVFRLDFSLFPTFVASIALAGILLTSIMGMSSISRTLKATPAKALRSL